MTAPLVWIFFALLALSVPVAHAMLGGVAAALWLDGKPLAVMVQRLYSPTQSFPMLAIPFFILAGSLMIVVPLLLIGFQHRRREPPRGFNPAPEQQEPRGREASFSAGKIRLAHECRE